MQTKIYKEDKGVRFGKWIDKVSKLMYYDSTKEILSKIKIPEIVADYGGANGILKEFIPNIISIDIDKSKNPDIIDNIITHKGKYDLIIVRFVLHYLNDYQILELFNNIKKYHKGKVLIIQFTNNDLISKYENSRNEFKYFRTENQLDALLISFKKVYVTEYEVTKEFYKNRLDIDNAKNHNEKIIAYYE